MANILVAGAGHGGVTAAILLAQAGHSVTILEQSASGETGYPQNDAFDMDCFEYAGIPLPDYFPLGKNKLTLVPLDPNTQSLTLPCSDMDSVIIDRQVLIGYLLDLAEKAGARIIYNCMVISPIMLGSRVAGVTTNTGDYYADLVIDACGLNSPLRNGLPDFTYVNRKVQMYDTVYTYRAYFKKLKNSEQPETDFNVHLKEDGREGFYWVVNEADAVDVLILKFTPLDRAKVLSKLHEIYYENPHISKDFIKCGRYAQIPVCQPLGMLIADGYAAVGDSAFMTYAIKGSGIAYSIRAGKILADTVLSDINGMFNCETLWDYQKRFFKEIGFSACRIALVKNTALQFTAEEISNLLKSGIITTEELAAFLNNTMDIFTDAAGRALLKSKIKQLRENAPLKKKISDLAVAIGKFAVTETYLPSRYDRKDAIKWVERYNEFFNSVKNITDISGV